MSQITEETLKVSGRSEAPSEAKENAPRNRLSRRPSDRFRREDERRVRHRLAKQLATIAAHVVAPIPDHLRDRIADLISMIWIRMTPVYRANVMANIAQVLGHDVSGRELERLAAGVFRMSARNFGELLRLRSLTNADLAALVPISEESLTALREANERGQGVIIATAHMGAFDLMGHAIGAQGVPFTVITGRTTSRFLFDAVTHLRQGHNCAMVEPTPAGVRQVIRSLRNGEVAGFVTDYDFFQNGVPVTFFGKPTTLPPGPIRIARDTGALVVPLFPYRDMATGRHHLQVGEPFEVPKTRDIDADLASGMERLRDQLETGIGAHPEQWVLFQRAWPLEPSPAVRVFPVGSPLESELLKKVDAILPPPRDDGGGQGDRGIGG
jgi:KDO2-lipid IV(A) lauroyltransferase